MRCGAINVGNVVMSTSRGRGVVRSDARFVCCDLYVLKKISDERPETSVHLHNLVTSLQTRIRVRDLGKSPEACFRAGTLHFCLNLDVERYHTSYTN